MLQVARIQEDVCIGCAACVKVCPSGAIVGATKHRHTVLPELCTACEACVQACPVEACIGMDAWSAATHPAQGVHAAAGEALVAAHTALRAAQRARVLGAAKLAAEAPTIQLPAELAALAAIARKKSEVRYAQKGQLKTPRLLKDRS